MCCCSSLLHRPMFRTWAQAPPEQVLYSWLRTVLKALL
jgi:hypothetical protein